MKEEELQTLGEFNGSDCICIHVNLEYSITSKVHGACPDARAASSKYRQTCILQVREHLDRDKVQSKLCKSDTEQEQSRSLRLAAGYLRTERNQKEINSSYTSRTMLQICGMGQCMYVGTSLDINKQSRTKWIAARHSLRLPILTPIFHQHLDRLVL